MNEHQYNLNGKCVGLSQPVSIPASATIGRTNEIKKIMASWLGGEDDMPLSPLLIGKPGVGKNRLVYACSLICDSALYILLGHEDMTAEDLIVTPRISDDRKRHVDYILSPLASAMITGGILFLDEIGKIRSKALTVLVSLLDERRYVDSVILGERIAAHPAMRVVAATNTTDLEMGRLPDYIRSRLLPMITVGNLNRKELNAVIAARFSTSFGHDGAELLEMFWNLWRDRHQDVPPTPRDSLQIFSLARKLADFEVAEETHTYSLMSRNNRVQLMPAHIQNAFDVFHEPVAGGVT